MPCGDNCGCNDHATTDPRFPGWTYWGCTRCWERRARRTRPRRAAAGWLAAEQAAAAATAGVEADEAALYYRQRDDDDDDDDDERYYPCCEEHMALHFGPDFDHCPPRFYHRLLDRRLLPDRGARLLACRALKPELAAALAVLAGEPVAAAAGGPAERLSVAAPAAPAAVALPLRGRPAPPPESASRAPTPRASQPAARAQTPRPPRADADPDSGSSSWTPTPTPRTSASSEPSTPPNRVLRPEPLRARPGGTPRRESASGSLPDQLLIESPMSGIDTDDESHAHLRNPSTPCFIAPPRRRRRARDSAPNQEARRSRRH
ncbi:hypothetical protein GGS23DRAFT_610655 [Durotheca rogersii]|uniref:uncharacterized protein n=1 Tax=Durotheca rogersii TaxID=419775 RepID=UPI002220A6BE|nr:uncharacterized protein GGS23DRAFT_610655 [Durotheca rogersii]KAI5862451.1 hypothetical protein GGS23DRAFT_610655 [Durotheca rogersii]